MTKKQKTKKDSGEKDYLISYLYVNELARDEIKRLRNEIKRLTEWQPIETAPKDGTLVLVYDKGYIASWYDGHDWLYGYNQILDNPTHWMPIPKQPV